MRWGTSRRAGQGSDERVPRAPVLSLACGRHSFVSKDLDGRDAGGVSRGIQSCEKAYAQSCRCNPEAVERPRFEGDKAQRVDGFIERNPVVFAREVTERVSKQQTK